MLSVSCVQCGRVFTYPACRGRRRKYCSDECRNLRYYGKPKTAGQNKNCLGCGVSFPELPASRNPRKWCSEKCRVATYYIQNPQVRIKQKERAKAKRQSRRLPPKKCLNCGAEKASRKGDYCKPCGKLPDVRRVVYRGFAKCTVESCDKPVNGRGLCRTHYQQWWRENNRERARARARKGNSARKALLAGATLIEDVVPEKVFELDGWRCHLCGKKINRRLRWPHLMSASIDHVVPLSKGGSHTYANCRAAHYSCNAAKCNRGDGEQLVFAVS